ncbi:hypothetical protein HYX13_05110 [Candidatus Woesearchaeota archaeon]|nr:hypothetical protein [Candidatus Woesearchaeota archaeon]
MMQKKKEIVMMAFYLMLLFSLFSPSILAIQHGTPHEGTDTLPAEEFALDYENPEYINALPPQDLFAALQRGDIRDLSLVDDDRLAMALVHDLKDNNPEILQWIGNDDLFRALRADAITLMSNTAVVQDFQTRISGNKVLVASLNEAKNSELRQQWFSAHQIILNKDAKIFGFTEGEVSTGEENNPQEVKAIFQIKDFPGATVNAKGQLILADGTLLNHIKISASGETITIAQLTEQEAFPIDNPGKKEINPFVKMSETAASARYILEGKMEVEKGNELISFPTGGIVTIKTEKRTISGEKIKIEVDEETTMIFTGTVDFYSEKHKTLLGETHFTDVKKGIEIEVTKDTEYYLTAAAETAEKCQEEKNCISYLPSRKGGTMDISVTENNQVKLGIVTLEVDKGIKTLKVKKISDASQVRINDNSRAVLTFSKEPLKIAGQPAGLTIQEIEYSFDDETGTHQQFLEYGRVKECPSCETVGKIRSEDLKLSAEEIIQQAALWGMRAAEDERYSSEWAARGENVYAFPGQNSVEGKKEPTSEYFERVKQQTGIERAYDCIGFQGEAVYQATGRGYRFDLSTEGETLSKNLAEENEGFERTSKIHGRKCSCWFTNSYILSYWR